MGEITGLKQARPDSVDVEIDGAFWRRVPTDVVLRAGLTVGTLLVRPRLRVLRRELRRSEALAVGTNALRARRLSVCALDERLRAAGASGEERREALETLSRAGFLDDARLAASRAESLGARNFGDDAIRSDLIHRGIEAELVEEALGVISPESERASRILGERGWTAATARRLTRKGFSADTVESLFPAEIAHEA